MIKLVEDFTTNMQNYGWNSHKSSKYYIDDELVDENTFKTVSGVVASLEKTFRIINASPVSLPISCKIDDKNDLMLEHDSGTYTVTVYRDLIKLYTIKGAESFVYEYCEGVIRDLLVKPNLLVDFKGLVGFPDKEDEESPQARRKAGLCPQCGSKGPFVNFTMTCKEHGPY